MCSHPLAPAQTRAKDMTRDNRDFSFQVRQQKATLGDVELGSFSCHIRSITRDEEHLANHTCQGGWITQPPFECPCFVTVTVVPEFDNFRPSEIATRILCQQAFFETTHQGQSVGAHLRLREPFHIPLNTIVSTRRTNNHGWKTGVSNKVALKVFISFMSLADWQMVVEIFMKEKPPPSDWFGVLSAKCTIPLSERIQLYQLKLQPQYASGNDGKSSRLQNMILGSCTQFKLNLEVGCLGSNQPIQGSRPANDLHDLANVTSGERKTVLSRCDHFRVRLTYHLPPCESGKKLDNPSREGYWCFWCLRTLTSLEQLRLHFIMNHKQLVAVELKSDETIDGVRQVNFLFRQTVKLQNENSMKQDPKAGKQSQPKLWYPKRQHSSRARTLTTGTSSRPVRRSGLRSGYLVTAADQAAQPATLEDSTTALDSANAAVQLNNIADRARSEGFASQLSGSKTILTSLPPEKTSSTSSDSSLVSRLRSFNKKRAMEETTASSGTAESPSKRVISAQNTSVHPTTQAPPSADPETQIQNSVSQQDQSLARLPLICVDAPDKSKTHEPDIPARLSKRVSWATDTHFEVPNTSDKIPRLRSSLRSSLKRPSPVVDMGSPAEPSFKRIRSVQKKKPSAKRPLGPTGSTHDDKTASQCPVEDKALKAPAAPSENSTCIQPSSLEGAQWLDSPPQRERRKLRVPKVPKGRDLFRNQSRRLLAHNELVSDSEEELDSGWVKQKHNDTLNASFLLDKSEKVFLKIFDEHFLDEQICQDRDVPAALRRFSARMGSRLKGREKLEREFVRKMMVMRADTIITDADIVECRNIVQNSISTEGSKPCRLSIDVLKCGACDEKLNSLKQKVVTCAEPVSLLGLT